MIKIGVVALLAVHGLIHTMGFLGTMGLAQFEGASRVPTNVIVAGPEDLIVRILGLVWLIALAGFLLAAVLLVMDAAAWRPVAMASVAVSMVVVILWWGNAPMGAVANALVLAAVILAPRLEALPA